jgi:hypothetical protein
MKSTVSASAEDKKEEDTWYNEQEYRQSKWLLQLSPMLQHSEK